MELLPGLQDSHDDGTRYELPDTRPESPCMPHVIRVQWEPDDHVAELSRMLQGMIYNMSPYLLHVLRR